MDKTFLARSGAIRPKASSDEISLRTIQVLGFLFLTLALALPLASLLLRAFEDQNGSFVGLRNFAIYVTTPSLVRSAWNSIWTALTTTCVVIPLAFAYAYGITRSCIPGKWIFRAIMLLPILAPSLLPALSLIYLFGNQGMLRWMMVGGSIYGPWGIIGAQIFYCFPAAAIILAVALSTADGRLYEAAEALKASRFRIFLTVTLPGALYGLVSASVVVFTLVVTDFGIPKVIGGQFNVLATDVYKQVVGRQDLNMGAVVGLVLLIPAVLAFLLDRWAHGKRTATLSGRAVAYRPKPRLGRDVPAFLLCLTVAFALLVIVAVSVWGSFIRFWPYNLSLTLDNYDFARFDTAGWQAVWLSVKLSLITAFVGTTLIFIIAYSLERGPQRGFLAAPLRFLATIPLAVPGLVLGLAFIIFFNHPANPLGIIYGTLAILVLNSIIHFYTVGHLTAVTAIRQLDPEFEAVSASLHVPIWQTFGRVTLPICLPAILEILIFLFVSAMTTVSAVIFLYGPDTKPASIAVVHMDEAGQASAAAAMACVILVISLAAKLIQLAAGGLFVRFTSAWRR
jgi:iron(III) transport system permease protein